MKKEEQRRYRFVIEKMRNKMLPTTYRFKQNLEENGLVRREDEKPATELDNHVTYRSLESHRSILGEIDHALKRLDAGTFGTCEGDCGMDIPRNRLEAIPYARFCIACAEIFSERGAQIAYQRTRSTSNRKKPLVMIPA